MVLLIGGTGLSYALMQLILPDEKELIKKLPKPIHKYEPTLNKSNRAPMSNNSTESSTDQSNISDVKKESKTAGK
ncbi:hypothetical protein PV326_000843 [Microctonus aethiopoides]|uniref:Uncharacterized protein n=1 Tax=Microctonus aethiopoides TaxID=144406 RepID=A0AA39FZG9_9HYME|nr:hypothetical protein PV326_000843 [Microctonus aethiopoides]KAK0178310.1 hypothetical protein PV328_002272 [Microctonus aethiopoides]